MPIKCPQGQMAYVREAESCEKCKMGKKNNSAIPFKVRFRLKSHYSASNNNMNRYFYFEILYLLFIY